MNTTTEIDLKPFCHTDVKRYAMDKPFVIDGWEYATDGRICVRIPADGEPNALEPKDGKKRPTKPWEIFAEVPADAVWRKWPKVSKCVNCNGTGNVDGCAGCKCGRCPGDADSGCTCRNPGTFERRFGKVELSRHYAALVATLPNVRYVPQPNSDAPLAFCFDGGEGRVMGLEQPE